MVGKTILIVEDDGILCANLQDTLTAAGYTVLNTLARGEDALEVVQKQQPKLIIMDIRLAGKMDGILSMQQIKTVADIPFIYITAYADDELIERARETLPYAYLVKPVQERELIATIETVLYKHSLEQEIKETKITLQESEEKYRFLTENMADIVWTVDINLTSTYVSPSIIKVLGFTPEERKQHSLNEMMTPEYAAKAMDIYIEELLREAEGNSDPDRVITMESEYYHKNGSTVWIENSITALRDSTGKLTGIYGVSRDITQRKEAEKEINYLYQKLNDEINKAAEIHKRILPAKIPEAEGISIAAHYQPATRMGGDFYNVIKSGNKLIVYLSDVMGHGLDGAMISVFVKEAIDNYIFFKPEALHPKAILQYLNRQYHRENYPEEQLICIFLGVLDLETKEFTYASAGFQTQPLVKLGNGDKEKLNCNGLFINKTVPYEMMNFEEYSIDLTPGTTILVSTDGLVEQESGEEWFYHTYEDVFYEKSHLPPKLIAKAINEDFYKFNNNSLTGDDDITYLILQANREINNI